MRLTSLLTVRHVRTSALGLLALLVTPAPCPAVVSVLRLESYADSLHFAQTELMQRAPAEAELMARQVLRRLEATAPTDSVGIADALDVFVAARLAAYRVMPYPTAEDAARALRLRERSQPPKDFAAAPTHFLVAETLVRNKKYDDAEETFKRVIALRESAWGPNDPVLADALSRYARFLYEKAHAGGSDYVSSGPVIRVLGAALLGLASEKIKKGSLYDTVQEWNTAFIEEPKVCKELREAEKAADRALAILLGHRSTDAEALAAVHITLADLARDAGDLKEARDHLERVRELRAGADGDRENPSIDIQIAEIYLDEMAPADARPLLLRVLTSLNRDEDPDSSLALRAHLGLARVHEALGDSAAVDAALARAEAFRPGTAADDWRHGVGAISLLARLRQRRGDLRGAESSFEDAYRAAVQGGGEHHPAVADVCMDLGRLHEARRDPKRAEKWFGRAVDIREAAFGDLHPLVADAWLEKAACAEARGNEGAAREAWDRAVLILGRSLGPTHPRTALARQRQALLYRLHFTGIDWGGDHPDPGLAFDFAIAGHRDWRRHVASTVRYLPENEALAVASRPSLGLDVALDLLGKKYLIRKLYDVRVAWDELIRSRSLVLDEMASRHVRTSDTDDPRLRSMRADLLARRQRLAGLLVSGAGSISFGRYAERIEAARREVADLEREVFARSAADDEPEPGGADVGFDAVTASLPPKSALVAYVRYRHFEKKSSEDRYLALYWKEGDSPQFASLGRAQRIDDAVARWRLEAGPDATRPGRGRPEWESAYRAAGDPLRSLIWDPIASAIGKADRVFIVPDGVLNLVNWSALPARDGSYLIETGLTFHYLTTERDLVTAPDRHSRVKLPLLFGGPDYDQVATHSGLDSLVAAATAAGTPGAAGTAPRPGYKGLRASCGDFESVRFAPLPGAEREVLSIASLLAADSLTRADGAQGPEVFIGPRATEMAFKAEAGRAGVVHIATHGFFLGGACRGSTDWTRAIGGLVADSPTAIRNDAGHPLRLSGLALAGANRRDDARPGDDDGILTAEEAAALDLRNADWVVLSACDTGVGDVRAGEGVFGLRRAFRIAGARTLVMSLWPIDDRSTQAWMQRLYEAHFREHLTTADATREACLGLLRERRERGESTHPSVWAGFVAVGGWQ